MKLVTTRFKSGGLHEKHVVATWNLGNHHSICLQTQGNEKKPVSRWSVAGPSEYLWYLLLTKYFWGDEIKNNERGGLCSTCRRNERCFLRFCWGNLKERVRLGNPGVDGRIMFREISNKWEGNSWTRLIWHRIVTGSGLSWMRSGTSGFRKMAGNFLTSWGPVSFSGRSVLREVN